MVALTSMTLEKYSGIWKLVTYTAENAVIWWQAFVSMQYIVGVTWKLSSAWQFRLTSLFCHWRPTHH